MAIHDFSQFLRRERSRSAIRRKAAGQQAIADRIAAIVLDVLRRRFPAAYLPSGVTFDDVGIDAFERVYIADEIEREWHISLPDDRLYTWQTLEDVTTTVLDQLDR